MDVICPQCGTTYELDESQIQGKSVRVKCSACEYMFRVYRPTPSQIIPALQTWIVRSADGVVSHVPDQSTLQRMIVERKVSRDDELSRDGRAWQLMGDVRDFLPFFAVVEQATASSTMLQAVTGSGVAFAAVQATDPEVAGVPYQVGVQPHASQFSHARAGIPGAVLIAGEMDPSSTLEFGLPGIAGAESARTDVGVQAVPDQDHEPVPVVYGNDAVADVSQELPTASNRVIDATEVALNGVSPSEAEMLEGSAVPVMIEPPSSPPQEAPSLPTMPAADERLVGGSGSQEIAVRVSPPTSTSFEGPASVSRDPDEEFDLAPENDADWFEGSRVELDPPAAPVPTNHKHNNKLSFDDDPPDASGSMSLDAGMRDFSSYSDEYDSRDFSGEFEMPRPASRKGLWIALSIAGFVLVFGGFYVLMPDLAARLNVAIGISEATPPAFAKVHAAQKELAGFTLDHFKRAQTLLTEAELIHGGPFPSSLAMRIEVELANTSYRLYQMDLARKQRLFWEQKKKLIDAEIARIPADDPNKPTQASGEPNKPTKPTDPANQAASEPNRATQTAALLLKKKAYQAQIDTFEKERTDALARYNEHWASASKYRTSALQLNARHLAVEMAELHLYSLSADADKQFRPLYAKLLKKSDAPIIETRLFLMAAWVSLHQKQYSQSLNRLRKVIADQPTWVYPYLLQARGWAGSKRRDTAIESLQGLSKRAPNHPLATAYLHYLEQSNSAPKPLLLTTNTPAGTPTPAAGTLPATGTPPTAATPGRDTPNARRATARRVAVARRAPTRRASRGSYEGLLRRADRLRRNERYKSARSYYQRAIKIKKSSRAYAGLGWCVLESSGPSAAIGHFQTAMRLNRRNPDALFGLGMAYRRQRKTAKARSTLKQFLSRFSRHRDAGEVRMILKSLR